MSFTLLGTEGTHSARSSPPGSHKAASLTRKAQGRQTVAIQHGHVERVARWVLQAGSMGLQRLRVGKIKGLLEICKEFAAHSSIIIKAQSEYYGISR